MRPRTGRTHQLRVHLASLGTPIVGDPIYGKPDRDLPGASLMLHAYRLRILLPGQEEASLFKAPLPTRFRRLLGLLERRYGKTPP
jgi:23S rRNA pseudouridine1911/1915/1917 synthase